MSSSSAAKRHRAKKNKGQVPGPQRKDQVSSGLGEYVELMALTKHSKYAAAYRLLALSFYAYNVLLVTRGLRSNWRLLFSSYSIANQKDKAQPYFSLLYWKLPITTDVSKLTIS